MKRIIPLLLIVFLAMPNLHIFAETVSGSSQPVEWTTADFTYGSFTKDIYGCDYSRTINVNGNVITGLSEEGKAKLELSTDLVIPAKDPDGNNIVGIGEKAFYQKGITSVRFPSGMMKRYDDPEISRCGYFVIDAQAFSGNNLTRVNLPEGVLAVLPNAFVSNQITEVTLPHTIWWVETLAFARNKITRINFPETTDFRLEMHGLAFAKNEIWSVKLPFYTEVVNKHVFFDNPGMEKSTQEMATGQENNGVVYMYTDNPDHLNKDRIHTTDRPTENTKSYWQKLILTDDANQYVDDSAWNAEDFTYQQSDKYEGVVITGLSESGIEKRPDNKNLVIPSKSPSGDKVVEIADTDNSYGLLATQSEGFTSVNFPNTVKSIGKKAFWNNGIEEVDLPSRLEYIGLVAFSNNNLTSVILPDSLKEMGDGAFSTNPAIERIELSDSMTVIPAAAFGCSDAKHYMTKLTSIKIPDKVTSIGQRAFAGNNFHKIDIPDSVKSIGAYAFSTKNYLSDPCTISLPEGLETIGDNAFRNKVIESVKLPATVQALAANTFRKEYSDDRVSVVTKVYVDDKKQFEDKTAFPDSEFHKLYLIDPNNWTSDDFEYTETVVDETEGLELTGLSDMGAEKFETNKRIEIPATGTGDKPVIAVGKSVFKDRNLESVSFGKQSRLMKISESAFSGNGLQSVVLPETVTIIEKGAFRGNNFGALIIPASVREIGEFAFEDNSLAGLEFKGDADSQNLSIAERAFASNNILSVQLPVNTVSLNGSAFADNTGVDGIVKLYGISSTDAIETVNNSKSDCQQLEEGSIPEDEKPWATTDFTYSGSAVTGLTETGVAKIKKNSVLNVPENTTDGDVIDSIGDGSESLGTFSVEENGEVYTPSSVILPDVIKTIGMYSFNGTSVKMIPEGVERIGANAFVDTTMTEVVIPKSVRYIGKNAFSTDKKPSVRALTIRAALTEIPESSFEGQKIETIFFRSGLKTIGDNAFKGNPISELDMPDTVESIGQYAFEGNALKEAVLPKNVTSISEGCFSSDKGRLTTVTLSAETERIDKFAFGGSDIADIEVPETLTILDKDAFKDSTREVVVRATDKDQEAGAGRYSGVAAKGSSHKVVYDKMAFSGWDYSDFTFSTDGHTITGWSESGAKKRMDNHDMVLPDYSSYVNGEIVTAIGDKAFAIDMNEVEIGKYEAVSPYGVKYVALPEKLESIGKQAFEYNNLNNSTDNGRMVPFLADMEKLTSIGGSAFHGNHLTEVYLPDTVASLGDGVFSMNNITELHLSRKVTVIPQGAFSMNIRMSQLEIPDTVTEIGDMAFAGARLESLDIPASVEKIGRKAFHLHHISDLTVPGTVRYIGESAFEGTYKALTLKKLTLEEGIQEIGDRAFKESLLEETHFPRSVKTIGKNVFENAYGKDGNHVVEVTTYNPAHTSASDAFMKVIYTGIKATPSVKLSYTTYKYSGAVRTPKVTASVEGKRLNDSKDYTVKYASGRKNPGSYTVKVTLAGKYYGSKTVSFKIVPKGTSIKSLTGSRKSVTVKWRRQSVQTSGYKIQYSTSSKFRKGNRTVTVSRNRTTSKKISKLKSGRKYYVRVRTYKTVKGKKYYSAWSSRKAVRVK